MAKTLADILSTEGYRVDIAESGNEAEQLLAKQTFDLAVLDMVLPDADGRELLKKWRQDHADMMVVIATGHGDVSTAVECIKAGAHDFLEKPIERVLLLRTLENAVQQRKLARQVDVLTQIHRRETSTVKMGQIVAASPVMIQTMELAEHIARSGFSCLFIQGESGTGKGLFARTIHTMSGRAGKPFVEVDCSAIPPTLIESELFGHAKGAFTDAKEEKMGLFELADGGTLFLDEIGDMELTLQAKLLKVIDDQRFRRVGSLNEVSVDVAIVAATNQDAQALVASGRFRADLYYRLNVIPLELPPLRERLEDIPPLAELFITTCSRKLGKRVVRFDKQVMDGLYAYSWPGNVREFRNVVERGCILTKEEVIHRDVLTFLPSAGGPFRSVPGPGDIALPPMSLADAERLAIDAAMKAARGNKNQAARILDVHRTTLYAKLAEHGDSTP